MPSPSAVSTLAAPYSASRSRPASAPEPSQTAAGSPNLRASVSSSSVTFLTDSPSCAARTRISDMGTARPFRSDELLRGEELGRLDAAVALVLDDRARLTRRPLCEADHLGRRGAGAHLGRV